jgi:hypothetical protein
LWFFFIYQIDQTPVLTNNIPWQEISLCIKFSLANNRDSGIILRFLIHPFQIRDVTRDDRECDDFRDFIRVYRFDRSDDVFGFFSCRLCDEKMLLIIAEFSLPPVERPEWHHVDARDKPSFEQHPGDHFRFGLGCCRQDHNNFW